jgi:hypothetical protein
MSGAASFQSVRKSWYAVLAFAVSLCKARAQKRESANGLVQYDPTMVENFLELSSGLLALMSG